MVISGMPVAQSYALVCLNSGSKGPIVLQRAVDVRENPGLAKTGSKVQVGGQFAVCAKPGFETSFYFIAYNGRTVVPVRVLPVPLRACAEDGATLELFRREKGGNFMEVRLTGFTAGEKIALVCTAEGGEIRKNITVPSLVEIPAITLTSMAQDGGSGVCSVRAVREKEVLELEYDWDASTLTVDVCDKRVARSTLDLVAIICGLPQIFGKASGMIPDFSLSYEGGA